MAYMTREAFDRQIARFPPRSDWHSRAQLVPCAGCDRLIAVPADCANPWWREAHTRPLSIHDDPGPDIDTHIGYAEPVRYQVRGEPFLVRGHRRERTATFWIWLPAAPTP